MGNVLLDGALYVLASMAELPLLYLLEVKMLSISIFIGMISIDMPRSP